LDCKKREYLLDKALDYVVSRADDIIKRTYTDSACFIRKDTPGEGWFEVQVWVTIRGEDGIYPSMEGKSMPPLDYDWTQSLHTDRF
jgi:hypothetical protein